MTQVAEFRASPKQSRALRYLRDKETNEVFLGGGAGFGKSMLGCYWHIKNRINYPGTRGLIGREELLTLKKSTLVTFHKLATSLKIKPKVHYHYNSQEHQIHWYNGSVSLLEGVGYMPSDPSYERFGSLELTDVFLDEAPEIPAKSAEILQSRIRWMLKEYDLEPKTLLTGNPGDHWIKYKYVKDERDQPVILEPFQKVILATLADNPDKEFAAIYRKGLERLSKYDRERLLYGDWDATPNSGMEYFPDFESEKHMGEVKYDPSLPLHITWDFNVNPYITLLVAQIVEAGDYIIIKFLKEYCQRHPFNNTKSASQALLLDLDEGVFKGHREGVFFYGDATGKSGSTLMEDQEHNYSIVERELFRYLNYYSDRVPRSNPGVIKRRDFLSDILAKRNILRIIIDPSCINLRKDFVYLKQGSDGKKHKVREKDPITGAFYEKYGHTSDAAEYFICEAFKDMFIASERK